MEDVSFHVRCAQIYNDYVAQRFDHKRLLPNALIPVQDIDAAVVEIERAAGMGLRGLELPLTAPAGRPYFLDIYDPVWQAATDCGLPIAMHAGTGNTGGFAARANSEHEMLDASANHGRALIAKRTALGGFGTMLMGACYETIAHLVGGGVPERFPDLHFVLVETGASWLSFVLDAMDNAWTGATVGREVNRTFFKPDGSPVTQFAEDELFMTWPHPMLPSDYVKRQFHIGFMDDYVGLRNRDITGTDCLVWGNDYPHYEGTWPDSRNAIAAQVERSGLSAPEQSAIFGGTVARIYGIELPQPVG
jgi:predicted TIM-barrel fold metal-dependent hydrolase